MLNFVVGFLCCMAFSACSCAVYLTIRQLRAEHQTQKAAPAPVRFEPMAQLESQIREEQRIRQWENLMDYQPKAKMQDEQDR